MAYQTLSFVIGQVLTAAQMNQMMENVDIIRRGDFGAATPSSPAAGTWWWDTASLPYQFKFYTGSAWIPTLFYDPAQNETGLSPPGGEGWGSVPMVNRDRNRTDYAGAPWTPKNMLLNGGLDYWQRGNSFSVRSGSTYTADRWRLDVRATSATIAVRQSSFVPGDGATDWSLELQVTYPQPNLGSRDVVQLVQPIDGNMLQRTGWNRPGIANRTTRLSFYVWSNVTGYFTLHMANASRTAVVCQPISYTTASAWRWVQFSVNPPSSAFFPQGLNAALYLGITFAAGSGMVVGTPGAWLVGSSLDLRAASGQLQGVSTSGTVFRVSDLQWELGEVATPFERLPQAVELPLLRFYYAKTFDLAQRPRDGSGQHEGALGTVTDDGARCIVNWPVIMRATPAVILFNPRSGGAAGKWMNYSNAKDGMHAQVLAAGETMVSITTTGSVVSTAAWDRHLIHAVADAEIHT